MEFEHSMSDDTVSALRENSRGDRMFSMMSAGPRRKILLGLHRGRVDHETDVITQGSQPNDIEVRLRHAHLPKLVDAGYIAWDHETGVIMPGHRFDEIQPLLELIDDHAEELPSNWGCDDAHFGNDTDP